MDDTIGTIIGLLFYVVIFVVIYMLVRIHCHKSRSTVRAFLYVSGLLVGVVLGVFGIAYVLVDGLGVPRVQPVIMGFAAAMLVGLVSTWRYAIASIKLPKNARA